MTEPLIEELIEKLEHKRFFGEDLAKWEEFVLDADIDEEFCTDWIPVEFGNGGSWVRKNSTIHKFFKVEKKRGKSKKIIALRLCGLSSGLKTICGSIPSDVREELRGKPCVFTGRVHEEMEIDHKIGAKLYQDDTDEEFDKREYFQPVCKTMNDAKRQACKVCQEDKKRFDAKNIGFNIGWSEGNEDLMVDDDEKFSHQENPCEGCYWYDPVEFRKKCSVSNFSKF